MDTERALFEIDFYLFKLAFLQGHVVCYGKEWVAACEQYIIEFGSIDGVETYEDVIKGLSSAYIVDPEKSHLRRFLRERLVNDFGL